MKALGVIVEDTFVYNEEKHLTVMKTSLFFAGDGYTVYDCKGELVFRVDSYGPDAREKDEIVLMDAQGKCLLTVRRKVMLMPLSYLLDILDSNLLSIAKFLESFALLRVEIDVFWI